MTDTVQPRDYVPAAGRHVLTPLYDVAMALTMRERTFRERIVDQVLASYPRRLVEIGCGTGSLTLRLARAHPAARVTGVDPDPAALARARAKDVEKRVDWRQGSATELPYGDESMDAVVASLLLHHLSDAEKLQALGEASRVLGAAGTLHVADWGRPRGLLTAVGFTALRTLDGFENTRVHSAGSLPRIVTQAGFARVRLHGRLSTTWGSLEFISASRV